MSENPNYVFEQLKPYVDDDHYVRVFDKTLFAAEGSGGNLGRVRVVAILPRKNLPLEDIPFAVAACSPEDFKHFRKDRANLIAVGRLAKMLETGILKNNVGVIDKLDSVDQLFNKAIRYMGVVPYWIDPDNFVYTDGELAMDLSNRLENMTKPIDGRWDNIDYGY